MEKCSSNVTGIEQSAICAAGPDAQPETATLREAEGLDEEGETHDDTSTMARERLERILQRVAMSSSWFGIRDPEV